MSGLSDRPKALLYFNERFAFRLGHENVTEHAAGKAQNGERGIVDDLPEPRRGLVGGDSNGGRQRQDEHDGRVGQSPGVGREILALDNGQHGHDADVDEELDAWNGREHRQPPTVGRAAAGVPIPQDDDDGYVTDGRAETRREHQRPAATPVHG